MYGQMDCKIYPSAFSGEVVVQVNADEGNYEGIAPKHYVNSTTNLKKNGITGKVKIFIISNDGNKARVRMPDEYILTVSSNNIQEI